MPSWSVACPYCNGELYKTSHPEGLYSPDITGPKLFWRDAMCYMECPNCFTKVRLEGTREMRPNQLRKTKDNEPT